MPTEGDGPLPATTSWYSSPDGVFWRGLFAKSASVAASMSCLSPSVDVIAPEVSGLSANAACGLRVGEPTDIKHHFALMLGQHGAGNAWLRDTRAARQRMCPHLLVTAAATTAAAACSAARRLGGASASFDTPAAQRAACGRNAH